MYDHGLRLSKLRIELNKASVDAFFVTSETNVRYLSDFRGGDSLIVITPDSQFFLTDSRYIEEAGDTVKGFTIAEVATSTYDVVGDIVRKNGIKRLAFESMNLPHGVVKRLEAHMRPAKLVPVINIVENLRTIKDSKEVEAIKKSIRLTGIVLKNITARIRPGMSERHLSDLTELEFIKNGARISFETIAACGTNCSKPHAHPSQMKIGKNDTVMLDMGCKLDLYCSDITRMVFMGKVRDKIKEIYGIVRTAQERAIEKIRPGTKISEVDFAGRGYIEQKGYGKFFGHSLGHGIGMDVHEEPSVSRRNNDVLKPGMVFTVEPAIYLPKIGGVRIEDMVLVTKNGCEILTR